MKTLLILLTAGILSININAAESESNANTKIATSTIVNLNGRITDKITGENLAGVEVQLIDTDEKTYTDFDGNFEFKNIETGAHALKVQFISYRDMVQNVYINDNAASVSIKLECVQK